MMKVEYLRRWRGKRPGDTAELPDRLAKLLSKKRIVKIPRKRSAKKAAPPPPPVEETLERMIDEPEEQRDETLPLEESE